MIPYDDDTMGKHNLMSAGRTKYVSSRSLMDMEEGNILPTEFKSRFKKEIVTKVCMDNSADFSN